MCRSALCRAVQKCLLWQNDRVNADSVLFGTGGFCRLGLRKQCDNEQVLCCYHQSKQNRQNQNRTGKSKIEQAKTKQNKQDQNRQTNSRWDTRTASESLAMTLHVEIQFEETFRPSPCLEVCSVYLRGGRSDKFDVNSRSPWKTTNSRNNFDRQQNDGSNASRGPQPNCSFTS